MHAVILKLHGRCAVIYLYAALLYICMLRCYISVCCACAVIHLYAALLSHSVHKQTKIYARQALVCLVLPSLASVFFSVVTCGMLPRSIMLPNGGKFHVGKLLKVDKFSTNKLSYSKNRTKIFPRQQRQITVDNSGANV